MATDIAALLRQRIATGELPPHTVVSFKDLMSEWDVSMHIAFKALRQMRDERLVEKVPGIHGLLVTEPAAGIASAWQPPPPPGTEARARVVRTAIELADADGLAAASMRRIGERLGVTTMTPHKHVGSRARLETMMADAIFAGHPLPQPPAGDWRAQLELVCRTQWQMYRRHPWLARIVSFEPSPLSEHVVAHIEWAAHAMTGQGLAAETASRVAATAADVVRGIAMDADQDPDDTELFEFGLQRLLDGLAPLFP
ncbi:TetR/AcrR family transcriptional regulator C-terminal domain-containing protein [Dactylosporangium sp. NPDC006015]|uniref:TetR/AcrR family transcriptional regulator C-terminal domain-containing protein n=1 Tax=Dactylosporangium sp. NPDC006015 TaxID=3154576 RepID=UPI0033ABC024